MRRLLPPILLLIVSAQLSSLSALSVQPPVKREMRGLWVASVMNIDWPLSPDHSARQQQEAFLSILTVMQQGHLNTLFLQVRPSYGVLYKSKIAPWSFFARPAGKKKPPFDPLKYAIKQAHRRGIAVQAWFNPYRLIAGPETVTSFGAQGLRPEDEYRYGKRTYLDPSSARVQKYIVSLVREVATNYRIDGVHFDDYFYPYPIRGEIIPDSSTYLSKVRLVSVQQWRRDNVSSLIRQVHGMLSTTRPLILFGVSPFGIWRNSRDDLRGSKTTGMSSYDTLYADVLFWMQQGWIDYVVPQLYWPVSGRYSPLLKWWEKVGDRFPGVPIYIGHAAYKVGGPWKPSELLRQLDLSAKSSSVQGNVFFGYKAIAQSPSFLQELGSYYKVNTPAPTKKSFLNLQLSSLH